MTVSYSTNIDMQDISSVHFQTGVGFGSPSLNRPPGCRGLVAVKRIFLEHSAAVRLVWSISTSCFLTRPFLLANVALERLSVVRYDSARVFIPGKQAHMFSRLAVAAARKFETVRQYRPKFKAELLKLNNSAIELKTSSLSQLWEWASTWLISE